MRRLLKIDWDIIAGIAAAVLAIVMHLLHIVDDGIVFTVVLVLLALLLFRDLRREHHDEGVSESLEKTQRAVEAIRGSIRAPEVTLIGPRNLRTESRRFSETACGEMTWFNVCFLMFQGQETFDLMLRPAIENPQVTTIQFVADESEKPLWERWLEPKIGQCAGAAKVRPPRWADLPKTVSFILSDVERSGQTEALLSFWGEPFMAETTGRQVPRFVFRVHSNSELVSRLAELERSGRSVADS